MSLGLREEQKNLKGCPENCAILGKYVHGTELGKIRSRPQIYKQLYIIIYMTINLYWVICTSVCFFLFIYYRA